MKLMNQHGWYKNQFFMGGGGSPPKPPPTKEDESVQEAKKDVLMKKKYQKGREKSILAQTGEQGKVKKTVLG
jgi:hypothetical protein